MFVKYCLVSRWMDYIGCYKLNAIIQANEYSNRWIDEKGDKIYKFECMYFFIFNSSYPFICTMY